MKRRTVLWLLMSLGQAQAALYVCRHSLERKTVTPMIFPQIDFYVHYTTSYGWVRGLTRPIQIERSGNG